MTRRGLQSMRFDPSTGRYTQNVWEPETDDYAWDPSVFQLGMDPGAAPNPYAPPHLTLLGQEYDPEDPMRELHPVGSGNRQQTAADALTVRQLSDNTQTWSGHRDPLENLAEPDQETGEVVPDGEREVVKSAETSAETTSYPTEPAGKPTYTDVDARVSERGPHTGARPNPFGREDEPNITREELMARAAEAYDRVAADDSGRHWEDEFLQNHKRTTDDDVQRAFLLQSLWHGNEHGMRFREMQRREQAGFEQGLSQARGADFANRRISKGLAQSIAAARLASPEEAAELRQSDPLVKAFTSGAYGQGSRYENLEQKYTLDANNTNRRIAEMEAKLAAQAALAAERNASQERIANTYAKKKKEGTELSPEGHRAVVARTIFDKFADKGITKEQALAAAGGDFASIPDGPLRDAIELDVGSLAEFTDKTSVRPLAPGVSSEQAKAPTRVQTAVDKERATIQLKPAQIKENKEITLLAQSVRDAAAAWQRMRASPEGDRARRAYVQYGRGMPEAVRSQQLGAFQGDASDLEALVGQIRRQTLGLAQTIPELSNLAVQMGMTAETWDPFKGPQGFERSMERLLKEVRTRKRLLMGLSEGE